MCVWVGACAAVSWSPWCVLAVPLGGLVGDNIFLVPERVKRLAGRLHKWVALRRTPPQVRSCGWCWAWQQPMKQYNIPHFHCLLPPSCFLRFHPPTHPFAHPARPGMLA